MNTGASIKGLMVREFLAKPANCNPRPVHVKVTLIPASELAEVASPDGESPAQLFITALGRLDERWRHFGSKVLN